MTESRHMTHAKRNTIQQRNRNRTAIFHTRASQSKTRNRKLRALAITHTPVRAMLVFDAVQY